MKRALLVGINYVGERSPLRGCINDSHNMGSMLKEVFAFDEIKLILEDQATTLGILEGLKWLIKDAKPGDILVFHFSGHGSQLPSFTEPDGYEEIICPYDLDWLGKYINDDMLRSIFNHVPDGVNTTVILDCCHSGEGLDQTVSYSTALDTPPILVKPDALGHKFLAPPPGLMAGRDRVVQWSASRDINVSAMLIAACQEDQLSADAYIDGTYQGAATAALLGAIKEDPKISYIKLVDRMTKYMLDNGFLQRPELDGSPLLYTAPFLSPFGAI
jgi:hypothetical protein